MQNRVFVFLFICSLVACKPDSDPVFSGHTVIFKTLQLAADSVLKVAELNIDSAKRTYEKRVKIANAESPFLNLGLVNIKQMVPSIIVDLRYSSLNNFMNIDLYGDIINAYLQPDVAVKLQQAQTNLKRDHPAHSLIVYDAARPLSVQQLMWDSIEVPEWEKTKYLSNPLHGSLHNYGAAVDIGITDSLGNELDMGAPYDFFGELAYPRKETILLAQGRLTALQVNNRKILRSIMYEAGFFNIDTEWWHFNSCSLKQAILIYKIIE